MHRDIGRVYMVHWQGRRIAPEQRQFGRLLRALLVLGLVAAASLMAGFYSGLPVPLGLVQSVVALAAIGGVAFLCWAAADTVIHHARRH